MAKQLLLYVEGTRGIFYGGDLTAMQQVDFPQDIVRDLDIISKEKFSALIQASIDAYQLLPAPITFILSTLVTFDKDMTEIPKEEQQKEEQKFLDQVPFQEILSYKFSQDKKKKIVAANKDFVFAMKTAFEKRGFSVAAAVPLAIIQDIYPELVTDLNFDMLLGKLDSMKQYNMFITQEILHTLITPTQREAKQGKKDNKRLYLMVGVFGFLLILLAIVAVINLAPPKPPARPPQIRPTTQSVITPSAQASAGQQPAPASATSAVAVEGISTYRKITPTFYQITTGSAPRNAP